MQTTIAPLAAGERTVTVTFEAEGVTHTRQVNAVFDGDTYDADATAARVAEVARGVAQKIALGVIANPPPPEPEGPADAQG